jgi:hypothetical protein
MKPLMSFALPLALAAGLALLAAPRGAAGGDRPASPAAPAGHVSPVVVELFTSQGCSSCPPADHLLTQLGEDRELAGRVIPLSFHVDYWNYIGWQDPFSSADWSSRQNHYSEAFRLGRVYTPQLVVNGRSECVGSEEGEVRRRIAEALQVPPAGRIALRLDPAPSASPGTVKVGVDASLAEGAKVERDLGVWVALYETNLSTPVGKGENARRTLRNDYVVRRLVRAFTLPAQPGSRHSGEVALAIDPAWKRADLGVAAFLQDPKTLAIQGAAAERLR